MIHEVLIVPGAGYVGSGLYEVGRRVDNLAEADVIDRYIRAIVDELDNAGVRYRHQRQTQAGVYPNTFVLHCCLGWYDGPAKSPQCNKSQTFLARPEMNTVADLVAEAMGHWGQTYVAYEHRGCNPVVDAKDRLIGAPGACGLRLEPFMLNGPAAVGYCSKLEELGRDVGRVLTDYIISSQSAARNRPSYLNTHLKRT